jgi:aspartyl-tRNA synthetase
MARYGNDKPDIRFGLELQDITEAVKGCDFSVFAEAPYVKGICVPPEHLKSFSRGRLDKLTDFAKKREHGGAKGLGWAKIKEDGSWQSPLAKALGPELCAKIAEQMGAVPGSTLLFVADDFHTTHMALSSLRMELRDSLGLLGTAGSEPQWRFLWITDFPLFEKTDRGWVSSHHPFTMPRTEHIPLLDEDPGKVLAQAYDLVLNGNEIGGGSIRIHRPDVQAKVFKVLGLSPEETQQKFGFLLEAFRYGPPPHGGVAFGLDRIAMLMCGADSLRDVIAFPKTSSGQDLMTSCPGPADDAQLGDLYITHRPLPGAD